MLGDAQGSWLVTLEMGDREQQHNLNQHDFLPSLPRAAATPLWESQDPGSVTLQGERPVGVRANQVR